MRRFKTLLTFLILFSSAVSATAGELRLAVAASLREVVGELCADYTRQHPDVTCRINAGASGMLARQIEQGAPVDLFLSASREWTDYLSGQGMLRADGIQVLTGNRLVFVGTPGRASNLADLPHLKRIALGSPKSVPAGAYAEQTLRAVGIYDQLAAANKLVLAQDVRQALAYAERGEVDGAFVYRSDALLVRQAVILFEVPSQLHTPVLYPMALTASGQNNPAGRDFFLFLQSTPARALLQRFGFNGD